MKYTNVIVFKCYSTLTSVHTGGSAVGLQVALSQLSPVSPADSQVNLGFSLSLVSASPSFEFFTSSFFLCRTGSTSGSVERPSSSILPSCRQTGRQTDSWTSSRRRFVPFFLLSGLSGSFLPDPFVAL